MKQSETITVLKSSSPAKMQDKQNERDHRELRIDKVGVRGLRFPIQVRDKAHVVQNTIATIGMYVDLPKEFKGTHMSRFIEVLNAHGNLVHVDNITDILHAMQKRLNAKTAHLEMEFPFFLEKKAPVSGMAGLMDYTARFDATACGKEIDFVLTVIAGVTTLCPCSKAISQYGAHNQRGTVTVKIRSRRSVWIEDLIALVESSASWSVLAVEAPGREGGDRARLRKPGVCGGHGAKCGVEAEQPCGCDVVQGGSGKFREHPQPQCLCLYRKRLRRGIASKQGGFWHQK